MGDGKKLKEIIKEKGTNVKQLSVRTGIPATTLYSAIQRDQKIRFDYALRIANCLEIDPIVICSEAIVFENDMPSLILSEQQNFYYRRLKGLMESLDEPDQEQLEQFLYGYYMLDDDGREQVSVLLKCMIKQAKNRI
ncbi:MAG: XRE family transcriptional regulator [Butyrivibrio sp.]|nr:XRE family transcriptional regulator [Butyrivibrio sp.]